MKALYDEQQTQTLLGCIKGELKLTSESIAQQFFMYARGWMSHLDLGSL